jgi:hypothetical protein
MKLIPERKIEGLRFGQLLVNVLQKNYDMSECFDITSELFYLENDQLQKLIDDYLEGEKWNEL